MTGIKEMNDGVDSVANFSNFYYNGKDEAEETTDYSCELISGLLSGQITERGMHKWKKRQRHYWYIFRL